MREYGINTERQGEAMAAAVRIFAEHDHFIRNIIRLRVHDVSRRDDLFQDLFLELVNRPVPSNVQNIKGYLYRMILRDAVDLVREQEKERRHLKKYAERERIFIYKSPSRDAIEETGEQGSLFAYLIGQLRRREAQVMIMRFRDGYSISEIAAELGIDRRSVCRYLTSSLRTLRRKLAIQ